jgi:hypothetical protein
MIIEPLTLGGSMIIILEIILKKINNIDHGTVRMELPLSVLNVDHSYQRDEKPGLIKKIAENYSRTAVQALAVGLRADGTYWVVDGQQRRCGAILAGEELIPCNVFESKGPHHEAEVFSQINKDKVRMTPFEIWHSDLCRCESTTVAINQVVVDAGFVVDPTPSTWYKIACPSALVRAFKMVGLDKLADILNLLRDVWPNVHGVVGEDVIIAFALLFKMNSDVDLEVLRKKLSRHDLNGLRTKAASHSINAKGWQRYKYLAIEIAKIYDKNLKNKARINVSAFIALIGAEAV